MFKNVTFCTRHTGEQRELKIRLHSSPGNRSPSHRVGLLPLLLQLGAPAAPAAPGGAGSCCLCCSSQGLLRLPVHRQEAVWGDCHLGIFFSVHIYLKKK